ncbi:hypothetical protein ACOMHN_041760 [Nucella lapillus]
MDVAVWKYEQSLAEYRQMRVVQGWMYLSLESLAIVLMVPSAVAFLQDSPLSPHSVYLAATCLSQTWYMAILFSHYLCKLSEECFASKRYVQASIWLVSYSAMAARRCAYMFNALMSFQRYIAVAFPLKVERQITVTILGSTFLMLILNTPVNINEVVTVYLPHYGILKKEYYLYMVLRSCFAIISHTCDILVVLTYLLLSASFRKRFVALFSGAPCRTFAASDSRLSQS